MNTGILNEFREWEKNEAIQTLKECGIAEGRFIPFIESCGFKLKNIVKDGGVHFDEIDFKLDLDKNKELRFSDLERRDIYNFIKS